MEEISDNFEISQWRAYHTLNMLICLILYTLLLRSVFVFNYALSEELGITISTFSPIIVAVYVALVLSPFIGNLNNKYTTNSVVIFKIYSIIAGISGILFGLPFAISGFKQIVTYGLITCLTIIWLVFSIGQNISKFESYTIASQYNKDTSSHGRIRSLLSGGSWSMTSLFYVVLGYCIEFKSFTIFFGLGIMICIFPLLAMQLLPKYNYSNKFRKINNNSNSDSNDKDKKNSNVRLLLHYNWLQDNYACCLVFIILILTGISAGSADVIFNPLFMHVYGMSTSESGICTLTIAFAEISATLFLAKYSHVDYFKLVGISIMFKLLCAVGFILLIFCTDMNDRLTSNVISYSVSVALSIVFFYFWFFGWTVFYVIQLTHVYKFVSTKNNTSQTEFLLAISCCGAIGGSIGVVGTSFLWEYWDNKTVAFLIIVFIWFDTICIAIILYAKLHRIINKSLTSSDRREKEFELTQENDFLIDHESVN